MTSYWPRSRLSRGIQGSFKPRRRLLARQGRDKSPNMEVGPSQAPAGDSKTSHGLSPPIGPAKDGDPRAASTQVTPTIGPKVIIVLAVGVIAFIVTLPVTLLAWRANWQYVDGPVVAVGCLTLCFGIGLTLLRLAEAQLSRGLWRAGLTVLVALSLVTAFMAGRTQQSHHEDRPDIGVYDRLDRGRGRAIH
jgi:hypothetical protein